MPFEPNAEDARDLRARLPLIDSDSCDDGMLRRYLAAEKGNVASVCPRCESTYTCKRM